MRAAAAVWTAVLAMQSTPSAELDWLLDGEPTIEQVQRAAVEHAGCTAGASTALQRDARAMGALPELTLSGDIDRDHGEDLDAFGNVEQSDDDAGWQVSLDLQWDLADLAMSYERIRVLAETQRRTELRARVLEAVTDAYYERLGARAELELAPPGDDLERLRLRLRIEQLTAELDAWTGGEFSRRKGRGERVGR
jgi:hypothetical protein